MKSKQEVIESKSLETISFFLTILIICQIIGTPFIASYLWLRIESISLRLQEVANQCEIKTK